MYCNVGEVCHDASRYVWLEVVKSKERWDNGVVTAWQWRGHGMAASQCLTPRKSFVNFFPYSYALLGFATAFSPLPFTSLFHFKLHPQRDSLMCVRRNRKNLGNLSLLSLSLAPIFTLRSFLSLSSPGFLCFPFTHFNFYNLIYIIFVL